MLACIGCKQKKLKVYYYQPPSPSSVRRLINMNGPLEAHIISPV